MRRVVLVIAAALGLVALAAACSGDYDRYPTAAGSPSATTAPEATTTTAPSTTTTLPPSGPTTTTAPDAATTTQPPPPGVPPGRLAIVSADGDLLTVRPDGAEVQTVADAPPGGTTVQMAWSPDATRLAFSTTTRSQASIGVATLGTAPVTQPLPTAPYHLTWSATGTQLGVLRVDSVDTVQLALADAALSAPPRHVTGGMSASAAWSPDGTRMFLRVEDQLLLVDQTGATTPLAVRLAPSGAPAWLDANTLLVAVERATDRRLVRLDVDTGAQVDVLTYDGTITFVPDLATGSIAYQVTPEDENQGGGGRVSFPRPGSARTRAQTAPPPALDGVLAVHTPAGTSIEVHDEPATAFQWSPDGTHLAFLDPVGSNTARWRFWTPSTTVDGPEFAPSSMSREIALARFDLLASSTRWWAPDGSAFAFAGRVQGREGVWIVTPTGGAALLVHEGELVAWSPQ